MREAEETEKTTADNFVSCGPRNMVRWNTSELDSSRKLRLREIGVHARCLCNVEIGCGQVARLTPFDYGRSSKPDFTHRALGALRRPRNSECQEGNGRHAGNRQKHCNCRSLLCSQKHCGELPIELPTLELWRCAAFEPYAGESSESIQKIKENLLSRD